MKVIRDYYHTLASAPASEVDVSVTFIGSKLTETHVLESLTLQEHL